MWLCSLVPPYQITVYGHPRLVTTDWWLNCHGCGLWMDMLCVLCGFLVLLLIHGFIPLNLSLISLKLTLLLQPCGLISRINENIFQNISKKASHCKIWIPGTLNSLSTSPRSVLSGALWTKRTLNCSAVLLLYMCVGGLDISVAIGCFEEYHIICKRMSLVAPFVASAF